MERVWNYGNRAFDRALPRYLTDSLIVNGKARCDSWSYGFRTCSRRWLNVPAKDRLLYITTPIFYVNDKPHIGHLHSALVADCLKRFFELRGHRIQQAAVKAKKPMQVFCDEASQRFRDLFDAANIQYTTFIRTTEKRHEKAVCFFWVIITLDRHYVMDGIHEGWYSISDEAFYTESEVSNVTDSKSGESYKIASETGKRVEWTQEENYKFRLSEFQERLLHWLATESNAVVPSNRYNEVKSWIQTGLSDLSVSRSRSRLNWGIRVPDDPEQTIYVWLDALINYLTVTGYPWPDNSVSAADHGWPPHVHIIGKDISRFHAVYWPAFLMAANLPLPRQVFAHSHWTMKKMKMSKSLGNVIDPLQAMDKYGVDAIRYYLMRDGGIADDSGKLIFIPTDYSEQNIQFRYKKDLVGQLGNLVSRSASNTLNPKLLIPQNPNNNSSNSDDLALRDKLQSLPDIVAEHYQKLNLNKGLAAIFDTLAEANRHFTIYEPWRLVNDPSQQDRLNTSLFYAAESARIAGILLQPVMPTKMSRLLSKLGVKPNERTWEHAKFAHGWPADVNTPRMFSKESSVIFPKF
ncbi:9795_t:CDS:10 [Paraglomus brasilianum]|uniref:Probable methionine--tRNA ligase, mitochondrial n=1 Tax=Paraglomus brasilianum TaxID=144538 RepID=A0A9N9A661_9GLOM|nr:9795_t:CDS:10 [Paraglomus brasilianum]